MNAVYTFQNAAYINLTERCPVSCVFCVKTAAGRRFHGTDLSLASEPTTDEAWAQLEGLERPEYVFCGYGEPTYRLPVLLELSRRLRGLRPSARLRLNTIGLGSVIWERDIAPELAQALQAVSVSLNTADAAQWRRLHRPQAGDLDAATLFVRRCVAVGLETTVTAVELPGVDLRAVESLAKSLGAGFRLRPALSASRVGA